VPCLAEELLKLGTKAAIIHNLAVINANQGQIEGAINLYEQSLILKEEIGDLPGKAATLQQLGLLKYNSGKIEEAIAIYQQSLVLTERIGDFIQRQRFCTVWQ
jgi:tetratricopeptide (TPR) repeat protein